MSSGTQLEPQAHVLSFSYFDFHLRSRVDHVEIVDILAPPNESKISKETEDIAGWTPWSWTGHIDILKILETCRNDSVKERNQGNKGP